MPAKNSIKTYVENGYYHIYNRGVEKRTIFEDEQDYGVFLSYLKNYLSPKNINNLQSQLATSSINCYERDKILKEINLNNFNEDIKLLAYCLMPNHFHLIINQIQANSIDQFINSLNTRYVMYFNKKYKRVGPLFQGVYKAALVETDEQLLYLSAYVHNNPLKLSIKHKSEDDYIYDLTRQPSSLLDYIGNSNTQWIYTKTILSFFKNKFPKSSYKQFLLQHIDPNISINNLIIENN